MYAVIFGIGVWQRGGIRSIFCAYSRDFLLLQSPMEPGTGWGVQGGLCVETLLSVRLKKKRIREIYVYVNWSKGRPLCCVLTDNYINILSHRLLYNNIYG